MLCPTQSCALYHWEEPIRLLSVICKEMLCSVSIAAYQGMGGLCITETNVQNLPEELP